MAHPDDEDPQAHERMRDAFVKGLQERATRNTNPRPGMDDDAGGVIPSAKIFELKALLNEDDLAQLVKQAPKKQGRRPMDAIYAALGKLAGDPELAWIADTSIPAPVVELDGAPGCEVPLDRREELIKNLSGLLKDMRGAAYHTHGPTRA